MFFIKVPLMPCPVFGEYYSQEAMERKVNEAQQSSNCEYVFNKNGKKLSDFKHSFNVFLSDISRYAGLFNNC